MTTPSIDWPAAHAEALDILSRYLQIDTTNPPGNETAAARFLGSLLEEAGIETEYVEIAPGREALFARIRGDGSAGAMMLGNHTDVVPVETEYWTKPPFGGVVEDGRIYGRGAVDMKGCGVMQLMAMLLLRRHDVRLRRDLVFAAVPDEEAGSPQGMQWIVEHRPDLVDVEFALNEGGSGADTFAGQEVPVFSVATSEKQVCQLRLEAVGRPGHASVLHPHNSATTLIRALARLADWERPFTLTPETDEFVRRMAARGLLPAADDQSALESALEQDRWLQAMFLNTLNVTVLDAGMKANVIPARSAAVIDCRLLPGQTKEDWIDQVTNVIDDDRVTVTPLLEEEAPVAVDWDTELFRVIEGVVTDAVEDAVVTPWVCVGGTDNRFLRPLGIPAYGLIPCLISDDEASRFHGNDEYLTIENLNMGCELTFEIVYRMCV